MDDMQKIGRCVFPEKQKHGKIYTNLIEPDMIREGLK